MGSVDPNNIEGPSGYGPQGFVEPELFSYGIEFENKPTATAPAQVVKVTEQIDPNLDWSTFQLGSIAFGDAVITVPAGQISYSTQVDLTATLGIYVDVTANFNPVTGLATWTFTSIDPNTMDVPSDPLVGFLPPNDAEGDGMGFVNYSILPKASDETGAQINAQATVVFDANAPLSTADFLNTIDTGPPTSSVTPLPAITNTTSFTVSWSGASDPGGSGIADYNIYVSDDGGAYTAFLTDTTATSGTFTGQFGQTYSFYSVATDNVGNVQAAPTSAQATTELIGLPTSTVSPLPATTTSTSFTVSWSGSPGPGASSIASYEVFVSDDGGAFTPFVTNTTLTSTTFTGQSGHTYGFYSVATDNLGDVQSTPTAAQATTYVAGLPTSTVSSLPATTTSTSFTLTWTGTPGPGATSIASYSIFESEDGGPFTAFLTNTTLTSTTFAGQFGHTYGFYSVATDNLGHVQPTPTGAQAMTQIVAQATQPAVVQFSSAEFTANVTDGSIQIVVSRSGNDAATVSVVVSSPGDSDVAAFQQTISLGPNTPSATATIPIVNNGTPGLSDVVIPVSLSSPGPGANLGTLPSANLVIHDNNPFPPLVTVNSLKLTTETVKVGKGKKAKTKKETVLKLQFSGALNGAGNLAAYQVLSGKTKKKVTTFNKRVPLASATYSASATAWTVILTPAAALNLTQPEQLRITAADLTDDYGRALDGNDSGQPGADFVATFSKKGVTITSADDAATTTAVDLALQEDGLVANALLRKRGVRIDGAGPRPAFGQPLHEAGRREGPG